ncbi:hypothetical protein [Bradyrhizobium sp. CCBAU 45384]|uniref:hypothetical protein n=1 Tax=Bradyrhizobium sp. CCBAU 45384 TaxID=858428 RepID=UPI002305DC18|nr:hypothetical protein [Bradyrhizobium sp. CCBAU 45384]
MFKLPWTADATGRGSDIGFTMVEAKTTPNFVHHSASASRSENIAPDSQTSPEVGAKETCDAPQDCARRQARNRAS